jgi:hypothetical protein
MDKALGYFSACVDRRYWQAQVEAFLKETGLAATDVWFHTEAGGAGKIIENEAFAAPNHAHHSGAKVMGWGMHGDRCGGYPGKTDDELKSIHQEAIAAAVKRYPEATHYGVWSEGEAPDKIKTKVWLVERPKEE